MNPTINTKFRQYNSKRSKEGWATARYASHSFAGSTPATATVQVCIKTWLVAASGEHGFFLDKKIYYNIALILIS